MDDPKISISDQSPPKKRHVVQGKYPFGSLNSGQMFLVECPLESRKRLMQSLVVCAHMWCKRRGLANLFVCRTLPEGVGVYKIDDEQPKEQ